MRRLRSRRIFKFNTEEAVVHLQTAGIKGVVRVIGSREKAFKNFFQQLLFHYLFPKHSLDPLVIGQVYSDGVKFGMVTKVVRNRSSDYKKYQQWWYVGRHKGEKMSAPINRHEEFVAKIALPIANLIARDTGTQVNTYPVNVCNVNGKPLFFEIDGIDLDLVAHHLSGKPMLKSFLLDILQNLKKLQKWH